MKGRIWLLAALPVVLALTAGCSRGRPAAPAAPNRPPASATVVGPDRSEALADDLDKALGELEGNLNGVDTIEDLEQALGGS